MIWRWIIFYFFPNYPPPDHNLGHILNSDLASSYFPLKSLFVEKNFIQFGCFLTHILIFFCQSFRTYLAKLRVIPDLPFFARIYPRCFGSLPVDEEDGRAQFTNTHQSAGYAIRSSRNRHRRREEIGLQNTQLKTNTAIRKIQSSKS